MKNSTIRNVTYYPLNHWYSQFASSREQEILALVMLGSGIIGIFLNILTLIVLRSNAFDLKVYTYLRVFVVNSIMLCFWTALSFIFMVKSFFSFANTNGASLFNIYLVIPFLRMNNTFGVFIDILISFERVALFSNRFNWFKKLKPIIPCEISAIISVFVVIPYFFYYKPIQIEIPLNETEVFTMHFFRSKKYITILKEYITVLSYITDILPVILQVLLSIAAIVLIKSYSKNKNRINNMPMKRMNTSTSNNETRKRTRKMEIKITIMVIILTTISML
jgi:hypothetical protein